MTTGRWPREIYREACRRSHRILGHYLALWAWKRRIDCLVIDRDTLHLYLGIKVRREQRLRWLLTNVEELFPHSRELYQGGASGSLCLSRRRFPSKVFEKSMHDHDRIDLMREQGLSAAMLIGDLPSEKRMAMFLCLAAIGERTPRQRLTTG